MWPFKKQQSMRDMLKITLTDGQEFIGEAYGDVGASSWISVRLNYEKVFYPQHRVRDVRAWKEVK